MSTLEDLKALRDAKRALLEEMREAMRVRLETEERELAAIEAAMRSLQGLPSPTGARTIRTMNVDTTGRDAKVKIGASRSRRKHPALKKLYEAGVTVTALAQQLKEKRPSVSAWFAAGAGNRPVPRRHADTMEEKYGIPLSAWLKLAD